MCRVLWSANTRNKFLFCVLIFVPTVVVPFLLRVVLYWLIVQAVHGSLTQTDRCNVFTLVGVTIKRKLHFYVLLKYTFIIRILRKHDETVWRMFGVPGRAAPKHRATAVSPAWSRHCVSKKCIMTRHPTVLGYHVAS